MPSPSEVPARIFTVCRVVGDRERRYSYSMEQNPRVGFAFLDHTEPLTPRTTSRLMRHDTVREALGAFYVGGLLRYNSQAYLPSDAPLSTLEQNNIIVINQVNCGTPGARNENNTRLYVMYHGELLRTETDEVHNACRELHRLMGCDRCPKTLDECMRHNARFEEGQTVLPETGLTPFKDFLSERFIAERERQQFRWSDVKDLLEERQWRYWKTEIEGFTLVPPALLSPDAMRPGRRLELPHNLVFSTGDVQANREAMRNRSIGAASTRRIIRTECSKCYFGGGRFRNMETPCHHTYAKHCNHGAWTKEQVIDETLLAFESHLERSDFTMRNFEQALALGGEIFYMRENENDLRPVKWGVRGFTAESATSSRPRARLTLFRAAREARGEARDYRSVRAFREALPENLRVRFDHAPSLSRETLAIAAQATCARAVKSYVSGYYFQHCQPAVSDVRVSPYRTHLVDVGYWMATYERNQTLSSLSDAYHFFDGMPMFSITQAPKGGVLDFRFHYWPR